MWVEESMTLQCGGLGRTLGGGLQAGCTLGQEVAVGLALRTGEFGGGPFFQLFAQLKASVLSQQKHGAPWGANGKSQPLLPSRVTGLMIFIM